MCLKCILYRSVYCAVSSRIYVIERSFELQGLWIEVLCQLMDIIFNLYQRKTETIFVTKSLKIQKEKCREKENWSFEEDAR